MADVSPRSSLLRDVLKRGARRNVCRLQAKLLVYAVGLFLGETSKSIFGGESSWNDGKISDKVAIDEETEVRIIRKGVARYKRLSRFLYT